MARGRREPPPQPATFDRMTDEEKWRFVQQFITWAVEDFVGLPMEHQETHLAGASDALQTPEDPTTVDAGSSGDAGEGPSYAYEDHEHAVTTGAPTNATGTAASEGSGAALMRASATIKQGIVEDKGDILTHDGTVPAALSTNYPGSVLTVKSNRNIGWSHPNRARGLADYNDYLLYRSTHTYAELQTLANTYK